MRECECSIPNPKGATPNKPNDDERCVMCGNWINPEWTSNNRTVKLFYDRLEESLFHPVSLALRPPPDEVAAFREFRAWAEQRELRGREHFGHRHLGRDNCMEAIEEMADGANYFHFDILRDRRQGIDPEWALALEGAKRAFEGYQYAVAKRKRLRRALSDG